jgi:hypothetical protein
MLCTTQLYRFAGQWRRPIARHDRSRKPEAISIDEW